MRSCSIVKADSSPYFCDGMIWDGMCLNQVTEKLMVALTAADHIYSKWFYTLSTLSHFMENFKPNLLIKLALIYFYDRIG